MTGQIAVRIKEPHQTKASSDLTITRNGITRNLKAGRSGYPSRRHHARRRAALKKSCNTDTRYECVKAVDQCSVENQTEIGTIGAHNPGLHHVDPPQQESNIAQQVGDDGSGGHRLLSIDYTRMGNLSQNQHGAECELR